MNMAPVWVFFIAAVVLPAGCGILWSRSTEYEGNWVGYEAKGPEGLWRCRIAGPRFELVGPNPLEWFKGTFLIEESQGDIKAGDITVEECGFPESEGRVCHVIFLRLGRQLNLAMGLAGNDTHPTSFRPVEGVRVFLLFMR
jgi:hypothetical protein